MSNEKAELVIDVHGLSKSFNGIKAVDNISLQVRKGRVFGFLGPNGGGKTTTIRMICGLLIPDSGTGTCLGYNILTEGDKIKPKIGYMTQTFSLYQDLTVKENLEFAARMYGVKDIKKQIRKALETFEIPEKRINQLAGELSAGWKQRLALARTTIADPLLLLLDEPTAGVDPKARREFWEHIHRLASEGVSTLVSTHYMDEAERCDRLAYISGGKILTYGTREAVITSTHLQTWEVTGQNLHTLAEKLKDFAAVSQIVRFGQYLHVSGTNKEALKKCLDPFKGEDYQFREVSPNLEDAFINFIKDV